MSAVSDLEEMIEQFDLAQGEFVKGNPEPLNKLFSHQEDVTLNNPLPLPSITPYPLPRMDGNRLVRLWSVPHRSSEMARSLALRS